MGTKNDLDFKKTIKTQEQTKPFTYIELFSGIGAFHQAMNRVIPNSNCVFAADINKECARIYWDNYKMKSLYDLTKVNMDDIPNHDLCFFSPPCQAFSKGGKQKGFEEARGTLIFEVFRILKYKINSGHPPKYILMENVRNLVTHDNGNTIKVILNGLHELGYRTTEKPLILSPHQFGIPQLRERAFLPGIYDPEKTNEPFEFNVGELLKKEDNSIFSIINEKDENPNLKLTKKERRVLKAWDDFYKKLDIKVIGFPIWADYFNSKKDISNFPNWKKTFVYKNIDLYKRNKKMIDEWINTYDVYNQFTPTQRKFEWQAGTKINSVYDGIIQFRPSGMRVKVPTVAPALVAMVQTPIIGKYERRLSLDECLKLQDFDKSFQFKGQCEHECYKQLGNSICVRVLEKIVEELIKIPIR